MIEPKPDSAGYLSCTFCGKHQRKVRKLVRGLYAVICDQCVDLCNSIIAEQLSKGPWSQHAPRSHFCCFHQHLSTTQRYMHLSPAARESAIRLLDAPAPKLGDALETGASEVPQQ
jgi:ClpX C4-type zinc finger